MVSCGIMIQHLPVLVLILTSLKQCLTHASKLEECFNKVTDPPRNFTQISNTTESLPQTGESSVYYLLKTHTPVSWCEAYHVCQAAGYKLATVPSHQAQKAIQNGLTTMNGGLAWLAARKKDFGVDWSWTIPGLPDFEDTFDEPPTGLVGSVLVPPSGNVLKIQGDLKPEDPRKFLCFPSGEVALGTKSWYLAQNQCQDTNERLGTLEEIKERHSVKKYNTSRYWLGLHKHPWMWVKGGDVYAPVLYSHWKSPTTAPSEADCLGVSLSDGAWQSKACHHTTSYVICQERGTEPTTTVTGNDSSNITSTTVPSNALGAAVGVPVALLCITAIVFTVGIYLKRKDRFPQTWKTLFTRRARPAAGVRPPLALYRDSEGILFSVREADAYRPQAAVQSNLTPHTFRPDALQPQAAVQSNLTPHTFRPDAAQSNNMTPHSFTPVIPCDDIYSEVRDHEGAFKVSRPVQTGTSERRPKKPPRASVSDSSSLAPQSPGSELYSVVRKPLYNQGSDSIDRSSVMVDNAEYGCTDDVSLSGLRLPETFPEYSQTLPTARPLVPQKPVQAKSQTMAKLKIRNQPPPNAMTSPSDVYAEVDKTKKKNTFPPY